MPRPMSSKREAVDSDSWNAETKKRKTFPIGIGRRPKSFPTLKSQAQKLVDALAHAIVKKTDVSIPRDEFQQLLRKKPRIPHVDSHVNRAAFLMEANDVLLEKFGEQGVVDIIKEMAIERTATLDPFCDKCANSESIFEIKHLKCVDAMHVPQLERRCAKCIGLGSRLHMHRVCQKARHGHPFDALFPEYASLLR